MTAGFARPGNPADIPAIISCSLDAWRLRISDESLLPSTDVLHAGWQQYFDAPRADGRHLLVATADDQVVGWLMSDAAEDLLMVKAVEILDITIHPEHLRQGHGSRLVHALVDLCRREGADAVEMWCMVDDTAVTTFLSAQGFAPDGALRRLSAPGFADDSGPQEARMLTDIRVADGQPEHGNSEHGNNQHGNTDE